jgi:penicillin-binding protein 2
MLILDQLRKSDRKLQFLSIVVLAGIVVLVAGLWYVQVISRKKYEDSLKIQSFRTVPIPAVRGRILDRNGLVLADNEPRFNVNVFLDDLPRLFSFEYTNSVRKEFQTLSGQVRMDRTTIARATAEARYRVVSNIVSHVSQTVGYPVLLNPKAFAQHYSSQLALPLRIFPTGLTRHQLAVFMEKGSDDPGVDLDVQPTRTYPYTNVAAHVLGYLRPDTVRAEDDDFQFSYPLPTFVGRSGVESVFDEELRGKNGVKSILVNNIGYRQKEEIWAPAQPGENIYLTIDLAVQKATDQAMRSLGTNGRAAAIVMDVRNGDILATSSYPSYDPNLFMDSVSSEEWERLSDPKLLPQLNRAFTGTYPPGSVFKIIDSLVALENGLDPDAIFHSEGQYQLGRRSRPIRDTAEAGEYDFRRAFAKSSNSYFIDEGLKLGEEKLIEMGRQFHFGELTGVLTNQEQHGYFPAVGANPRKRDGGRWQDGDTANLAIGQGEIAITPMQIAAMTAAVANRGTLFKPRLVSKIVPQESAENSAIQEFPRGVIRDQIKISPRTWNILHEAMLADVEDPEGSGRNSRVPGMRICGKTGTAQLKNNGHLDHITWFASFAPYGSPRYAVIVMVESGISGGVSCAPISREIYRALLNEEQKRPVHPNLATN